MLISKRQNKKGLIPLIVMVVVILALVILLFLFGTIFIGKATKSFTDTLDSIGTTNILIVVIIVLVIIFREPVKAILMSLAGFLK